MTSQALEEVREITHDLRPYHLDQLGLREAIEFMLEKVASSSKIRFSAEIDSIDGIFSKEAEMSMYRIVQESIKQYPQAFRRYRSKGGAQTRWPLGSAND